MRRYVLFSCVVACFSLPPWVLYAQEAPALPQDPKAQRDAELKEALELSFRGLNRIQLLELATRLGIDLAIERDKPVDSISYHEIVTALLKKVTLSATKSLDSGSQFFESKRDNYNRLFQDAKKEKGVSYKYDYIFSTIEPDRNGMNHIVLFGHCMISYGSRVLEADMLIVTYSTGHESDLGLPEGFDHIDGFYSLIYDGEDGGDSENDDFIGDDLSGSLPEEDIEDPPSSPSPPTPEEEGVSTISEIIGIGNVRYNDGTNRIRGDKFFFYFESQRVLIYKAHSKIGNWLVKANSIKRTAPSRFVVDDAHLSFCSLEHPHFVINSPKAWFYAKDKTFLINPTYQIGGSILFYFPFMLQSKWGTGIETAIGLRKGLGFYFNSGYTIKPIEALSLTLHLDYYEKIGVYSKLSGSYRWFTWGLETAYSRAVRYVPNDPNERFSNSFDLNQDGELDSLWSPRYAATIGFSIPLSGQDQSIDDLFKDLEKSDTPSKDISSSSTTQGGEQSSLSQNQNAPEPSALPKNSERLTKEQAESLKSRAKGILQKLAPTVNFNYSILSDPYFKRTFSGLRRQKFQIAEVYREFNASAPQSNVQELSATTTGTGQSVSVGASSGLGRALSLSVSGSWSWSQGVDLDLYRDQEVALGYRLITPYKPLQYYRLYRQSYVFPKISLSSSGTVFSNILWFLDPASRKAEDSLDESSQPTNQAKENDTESEDTLALPVWELDGGAKEKTLSIKLPFNYTGRFSLSDTQSFNTDGSPKSAQTDTSFSGGYTLPFSLSWSFLSFSTSHKLNLSYRQVNYRDETEAQSVDQRNQTYPSYSTGLSGNLSGKWFDHFEWINISVSGNAGYDTSGKLFRPLVVNHNEEAKVTGAFDDRKHRFSWGIQASGFKSSLGFSLSHDLRLTWAELQKIGTVEGAGPKQYCFSRDENGTCIIEEDDLWLKKRMPLSFSFRSSPFASYLSFSASYSEALNVHSEFWDRGEDELDDLRVQGYQEGLFGGRAKSFTISTSSSVTKIGVTLFDIISITSLSISGSYKHNFEQLRNHSAQINFSMSFSVTRDWSFQLAMSTRNSNIWYYTADAGVKQVSFFTDVFRSLAFWDPELRTKSYWKMGGITISATHRLHHWLLKAQFNFSPRDVDGTQKVWLPSLDLSLSLDKGGGFAPPSNIQLGYVPGRQASNSYSNR